MGKKQKSAVENETVYLHTRGVIKDNAVMALLHDKLFRQEKHTRKMFESPIINFLITETL